MNDDRTLHAHLIGRQGSRADLNTPALILDVDALDRNIAALAEMTASKGVALSQHAKTHKSVEIDQRPIEAGAAGVIGAPLGEANGMSDRRLADIHIQPTRTRPTSTQRARRPVG